MSTEQPAAGHGTDTAGALSRLTTANLVRGGQVSNLRIGGRTVRVCVRPAAPGPSQVPLLLLNGIGAALETLEPFVRLLPPGREVIRLDVPGVGGSPAPALPYSIVSLAHLVARVLTRLGHPRADVLGYSWGGAPAQQLAIAAPARVRRLVLVATGTGALMVPARPGVLARMLTGRRYEDPGHAARIAARIYGGTMRDHPERAAALLGRTGHPPDQRGYRYQLLALASWTSLPFLGLVGAPTLIVAGADDPIIPLTNARLLHGGIARSRLHVHPGGHLALLAEPEQLVPVVERFLAG